MASTENKTGKTEMTELTPIQKILNTLYSVGKLGGEHYKAAQQQYENLHGKLMNLKRFYPEKYEVIKSNANKKKLVHDPSKIQDEMKKKCPGLIQAIELAVRLKKDEDGLARRELMMLLDVDYFELKQSDRGRMKQIDPNTLRFMTLWNFLHEKQNMSTLSISQETAEKASEEFLRLKNQWEELLNKEEKKVRAFLNSKDHIKKDSLSSLKIKDGNPLHKVMKRLSDSKMILPHKDNMIYEYVTLVNVCCTFGKHLGPSMNPETPSAEHLPKETHSGIHLPKEASSAMHQTKEAPLMKQHVIKCKGPEGSEVDQRSHLQTILQTYWEDSNVDADEKDKSREEFLNLTTLRSRFDRREDQVSNEDQEKEDKLENIVTQDQRGVSESLFAALRYAKEKGLEKWQWAAAEFSHLADIFKNLGKEDQGARPKVRDSEPKGSALYELLLKWKGTDLEIKEKAKTEYIKITDRAHRLPGMKAEQNLELSVSMLSNPSDIPDDPESSTYHVLQILKSTDPEAKKYPAAWNEYICLLAEEQRFIQIVNLNQPGKGPSNQREHKSSEQVSHVQAPYSGEPTQSHHLIGQVQIPSTDYSVQMSTYVQAPCERQPQRIVMQEGEIRMPYNQWQKVMVELERKTQEVEELSSRLSRFASQQLTSGNPNIADLSDRNRPTKIGEMFGQLYDNEWSDAFDSLKKSTGNVTNETMSASPKSDKVVKKEMRRSRQEKDHSMRRELSGDRSNEKEKVIQGDNLSKSQKQSTRREDDRSGDIFNDDEHIDVNKDVDTASSVRGKKKTVAENIKKSAVTLVEKGVEGDGVESKQDIPDENSKEQAEENIKVREHSDKESGKCEGAEGGKDEERKEVEEVVEEEEDDFNMKELTILQGIVMAAYEFSIEQAALQLKKLEADIADVITLNTSPANSNPSSSYIEAEKALRKEFRTFASQEAKDFRKMVGTLSYKMAAKIFEKEKLPHLTENCPTDSAIVEYGNKCVELTWFMVVQDPPMKLVCPKQGEKFKKTEFAYHGRKGKVVELCVWPALYLYDGGPMVNKGHVLPAIEASM